jgi:hypothetical protein
MYRAGVYSERVKDFPPALVYIPLVVIDRILYTRGLLPLLFGQTPSHENHAKLLFTTGIPSGLRSAYYIKI